MNSTIGKNCAQKNKGPKRDHIFEIFSLNDGDEYSYDSSKPKRKCKCGKGNRKSNDQRRGKDKFCVSKPHPRAVRKNPKKCEKKSDEKRSEYAVHYGFFWRKSEGGVSVDEMKIE